jgi:peptide/nickel transport system substrate-binding protein
MDDRTPSRHRPGPSVPHWIRHRRTVARFAGGTAVILAAAIGAPAVGATPTPAPSKVTFTVGILNDVDSLNPFTGIVAESYEVWQTMYDTLTTTSAKDFSPVPSLATKWSTSPDGLTWTYTIRSGVKWSDGVPLTARDVAYTFNRVMKGSYEKTNYGSYVANITAVTAPNDTTVVMRTKTPSPIMLRLAISILPEHIWSKIGSEQVKTYKNEVGAVGSGPFVLTERKTGQYIRLTANKNYWGGAPKIDELVYRVYGNADALAQALKKGEVDFADNLDADVWESLQNVPGIKAYSGTYFGFDELAFNTGAALDDGAPIGDGNPALKNKKVRQALNYAIDRDTIVRRTLNGNGTPGSTIIPPIYADLHLKPATTYTFDLAKAGQLLDAAGYRKGSDGKRTTPSGEPLTLRMFARQESTPSQQAARLIQGWFGDLGIPVKLKVITEDNLTEQIGQGTYDMFEWGWVVEPDPDYQLSTFTCAKRSYKDGSQVYANLSDSFYCNPAYDKLYADQAKQIDPAARASTVRQMQQILYTDAPYAVLYDYDDLQAYSTKFTGFVAQTPPDGVLLFQYGAWTYLNVRPVAATSAAAAGTSSDSSGPGLPVIAIGGIAAVVVAAVGALMFTRRRRSGAASMDVE